jgi:hypothetical protein
MGAAVIPTILQGIGQAGQGAAAGQLQGQALAQNYALNKRGQGLQEGLNANALARQTQTNPLRDQAIYNLSGMLGASPAAFNPTSMLSGANSGPQGVGGVNQNGLAAYDAKYTPGAGGVTSNVQQMLMNRLGYGNVPTGTLFDNKTTPPDVLTGAPNTAITMGATNKGGAGVVPDPYSQSQTGGTGGTGGGSGTGNGPGSAAGGGTPGPGQVPQNMGAGSGPGTGMLDASPFKLAGLGGLGGAPAVASAAGGMAGSAAPPASPVGVPGVPTDPNAAAARQRALMAMLGGNPGASLAAA